MTRSINTEELSALLKNNSPVTLLDVRRRADYTASPQKITRAAWQDPEEVDTWAKQLPADTVTVAYCVKGGSVSQSVADQLHRNGLETVFLEGGIKAWIEKGHPVE